MNRWKLRIYSPESDSFPVRDWYDMQSDEVKAEFDVDIRFFRANEDWTEAFECFPLTKSYLGLYEVRTTVQDGEDELQFGAIGSYRADSSEFIFFVVGDRYSDEYPSCLDLALKCKQDWEKGKGVVYDYEYVMGQIGE